MVSPPRRHLQPVPGLGPEARGGAGDAAAPDDDVPSGLLADALADAMEQVPAAYDPAGKPALAPESMSEVLAAIENGPEHGGDPAASFLMMVERAEKVAPIRGDKARLAPSDLLRMIGDPQPHAAAGASPKSHCGARERSASFDRLARAAWDVIRTGAAEHEPELRTCLVQLCTRLAHIGSQGPVGPWAPGPAAP